MTTLIAPITLDQLADLVLAILDFYTTARPYRTLPERRYCYIGDYWYLSREEQDELRDYLALLYPESEMNSDIASRLEDAETQLEMERNLRDCAEQERDTLRDENAALKELVRDIWNAWMQDGFQMMYKEWKQLRKDSYDKVAALLEKEPS